jgi:hypothetical protein
MRSTRRRYLLYALLVASPAAAQLPLPTPAEEETVARCMGITIEDYRAVYLPTNGELRVLTREERDRQVAVMKRINRDVPLEKQAECQQVTPRRPFDAFGRMQQAIDASEVRMSSAGGRTEAAGKTARLSADPARDLARGWTAVRDIDWLVGQGEVSAAGMASFSDAMARLAPALSAAGRPFRVDFFLSPSYGDADANRAAERRMKTLRDALGDDVRLEKGKVVRARDSRIEFIRIR